MNIEFEEFDNDVLVIGMSFKETCLLAIQTEVSYNGIIKLVKDSDGKATVGDVIKYRKSFRHYYFSMPEESKIIHYIMSICGRCFPNVSRIYRRHNKDYNKTIEHYERLDKINEELEKLKKESIETGVSYKTLIKRRSRNNGSKETVKAGKVDWLKVKI